MYAEVATQLTTIAVTLVTCLTSVKAWDFWKKRMELQREDRQLEKKDKNLYVEELRSRLSILQDKFDALSMKREVELAEMNMKMQELTVSLAVMTEKVEQLQAENDSLRTMLEG
jgi:predicted RNase H-like nuclease (RuvC/YqgF family)